MSETEVTIGVDLGGTTTRMVVARRDGVVARERAIPTRALGADPHAAVSALVAELAELSCSFNVTRVGIGASGPIGHTGIVRNADTLANLSGVSILDVIAARLGVPTVIDNDAVTFVLGEQRYGAARGASSVLGVTLGTGVGAAYIGVDGVFRGGDGEHPEAGHIPVASAPDRCYCGLENCWEQVASRTALQRLAARGGHTDVDAAAVAARDGRQDAVELFEGYGRAVGSGLVTLCSLFRPECVVIGGGSASYADLFFSTAAGAMARAAPYRISVELRVSELGVFAGAVGASCLDGPPATARSMA